MIKILTLKTLSSTSTKFLHFKVRLWFLIIFYSLILFKKFVLTKHCETDIINIVKGGPLAQLVRATGS